MYNLLPLEIFFMIQGALSPNSETCGTEPNGLKKKWQKKSFFSEFEKNGFSIVIQAERVKCLISLVYVCKVLRNLCEMKMDV